MIDRMQHADRRRARLSDTNARLRRQPAEHDSFRRIAHHDALTGLWNHRYADVRLAEEMARARVASGYRFSVDNAHVDDLKGINERHGHAAGDHALRSAAGFLSQRLLRAEDVCCRIAGHEFPADPPLLRVDACRRLVKRARSQWHHQSRAHEQAVAVSLPSASYPTHGGTVESLCAAADPSMYQEQPGRSRCLRYLSGGRPRSTSNSRNQSFATVGSSDFAVRDLTDRFQYPCA